MDDDNIAFILLPIDYKVLLDDLDYMGIVGNAEWLTFLTRARIELLEKIGFPFSEMQKQKIGGVVAELNVKYLAPAYYNDKLAISITPHSPFSKGLSLKYEVKNQHQATCLTADLKIIFVDQQGKSIAIPEPIKAALFSSEVA